MAECSAKASRNPAVRYAVNSEPSLSESGSAPSVVASVLFPVPSFRLRPILGPDEPAFGGRFSVAVERHHDARDSDVFAPVAVGATKCVDLLLDASSFRVHLGRIVAVMLIAEKLDIAVRALRA
jgi:hypothetical protein